MKSFKYKISLVVEVEAFDAGDAWEAVQDAFGIGDNMGITVLDCEYEETK